MELPASSSRRRHAAVSGGSRVDPAAEGVETEDFCSHFPFPRSVRSVLVALFSAVHAASPLLAADASGTPTGELPRMIAISGFMLPCGLSEIEVVTGASRTKALSSSTRDRR